MINTLYSIQSSVSYLYEVLQDGYREKKWIFTSRNAYPMITSSEWTMCLSDNTLIYSPASHAIEGAGEKQSLESVTLEVVSPDGTRHNLSSFSYTVKWQLTPSLYELVLLYFLHEKMCIPTQILDTYTVEVLTMDLEEVSIPLSSAFAKAPFCGFVEGLKVD
jgi:hypothetical protein